VSDIGYATLAVIPSAKGFGKALSSQVDPELSAAGHSGGLTFGKALSGAALIGFGALAAGIGMVLKTGIGEAMDASAGTAQLAAGIKSTGNAAGVTVGGLNTLASSIQGYSGQTDDSIVKAEQLLLTFTKIQNNGPDKIFDLATVASANMAAKMGGDASSNALLLGKALNDPVKGTAALTRAGVQFTDAQKAAIEAMVASGDTAGAQKIILGELETQFGGAAKAAGESLPGQMAKAQRAFEDISQQIVETIIPLVLPALQSIGDVLTNTVVPAVQGFIQGFKDGTGAGGTFRDILSTIGGILQAVAGFLAENSGILIPLAIGIGIVVAAIQIWTVVQGALNTIMALNPIMLIVIAIAALIAALVIAYNKSDAFRAIVDTVWSAIQTAVAAVVDFFQTYVMPILKFVFDAIVAYVQFLWTIYEPIWNLIKAVVEKVVTWFKETAWPAIKTFIDLFVLGVQTLWADFQPIWTNIQNAVKKVVDWFTTVAWPAIKSLFIDPIVAAFQTAWPIIQTAWDTIMTAVKKVVDWFTVTALPAITGFVTSVTTAFGNIVTFVTNIPGKITTALGDLGSTLYQAGSALIGGLLQGITEKFEAVKSFVGGIGSWVADHKGPLSYDRQLLIPAGVAIMDGLSDGLRSQMGTLAATTADVTDTLRSISTARALGAGTLDFAPPAVRTAAANGALFGPTGTDMPAFNVRVYVGDRELTDIVDTRIEAADGRSLDYVAAGRRF
jgi:phage-related protein